MTKLKSRLPAEHTKYRVADAPGPDEGVVAIGASVGGRPHHRIGNRYSDMEEMGLTEG